MVGLNAETVGGKNRILEKPKSIYSGAIKLRYFFEKRANLVEFGIFGISVGFRTKPVQGIFDFEILKNFELF